MSLLCPTLGKKHLIVWHPIICVPLDKCARIHHNLPYKWQILQKDGTIWSDLPNEEEIEKAYCSPANVLWYKDAFSVIMIYSVTLVHKSSLMLHTYVFGNRKKNFKSVKCLYFTFMPKITQILSKAHVLWRHFILFLKYITNSCLISDCCGKLF